MASTSFLTVPAGWHRHPDPAPGVLVAARGAAPPGSGVAPELVLHRTEVPFRHTGDLSGWRAAALDALARALDSFALEDAEVIDLDGREVAYARFGHRGVGTDLVTEQWSWLVGESGLTLTATVALEDYADLCDVVEQVACSVEPRPVTPA